MSFAPYPPLELKPIDDDDQSERLLGDTSSSPEDEEESDQPTTSRGQPSSMFGGRRLEDSSATDSDDDLAEYAREDDERPLGGPQAETLRQFAIRQYRNIVHFFVEDWFLSAMLGIITAFISIGVDVGIEYLIHMRRVLFDIAHESSTYLGFSYWILHIATFVTLGSSFCFFLSRQAVGSGIPEVKVIISGYVLKNYLSLQTLIAKVIGLTFTLGGGLPVGKEGPFVHMGAIVASLLTRVTTSWRFNEFFVNESRENEMLSMGCAVGIACTFSAPAGGVLYGIESTSKYFAVKNYWRSFFATTCSSLIFRFAISAFVSPQIAGTISAYYQTNFPNEVFVVEEIPLFVLLGIVCGVGGAGFVLLHRTIAKGHQKIGIYRKLQQYNPVLVTLLFATIVGFLTYPEGFGRFIVGHLTFKDVLVDFVSNCTFMLTNTTSPMGCDHDRIAPWRGGDGSLSPMLTLSCYLIVYFFLIAQCITLYIPAGIFVPSFVVGACGGRLMGEILVLIFPDGIRGPGSPQIYPGLYAVVGAAAYTGAVTHSLSLAVIVCETTGQLCALLPVLIALMIANAIGQFLQPSIYESIINLKKLPYLTDLPPSRITAHMLKVEKVMVRDVVFLSRNTTYQELREIVVATPHLRSYPFVTDRETMCLLGSVSRRYIVSLLLRNFGPDSKLAPEKTSRRSPRDLLATCPIFVSSNAVEDAEMQRSSSTASSSQARLVERMNNRGNTLLASSPLHDVIGSRNAVRPLSTQPSEVQTVQTMSDSERSVAMGRPLKMDEIVVDPAPFQLVKGTSLYKVHTLFSLLGLNHAYVTQRGRLLGVVSLKELRETFAHVYLRGARPPSLKRREREERERAMGNGVRAEPVTPVTDTADRS